MRYLDESTYYSILEFNDIRVFNENVFGRIWEWIKSALKALVDFIRNIFKGAKDTTEKVQEKKAVDEVQKITPKEVSSSGNPDDDFIKTNNKNVNGTVTINYVVKLASEYNPRGALEKIKRKSFDQLISCIDYIKKITQENQKQIAGDNTLNDQDTDNIMKDYLKKIGSINDLSDITKELIDLFDPKYVDKNNSSNKGEFKLNPGKATYTLRELQHEIGQNYTIRLQVVDFVNKQIPNLEKKIDECDKYSKNESNIPESLMKSITEGIKQIQRRVQYTGKVCAIIKERTHLNIMNIQKDMHNIRSKNNIDTHDESASIFKNVEFI